MNAFVILIKREFWESKSLWAVPVAAALVIIATSIFGTFRFGSDMPPGATDLAGGALVGIMVFLSVVGGITVVTYLTDCLFAERKDRSILFWKSLPVSDTQTVLSKLAVAVLVMPLGLLILGILTHFVVSAIMLLRFEDMQQFSGAGFWSGWITALGRALLGWGFSALWYLPIIAYLMLASVAAKRAPVMYALLPPVLLGFGERFLLGTTHITDLIRYRIAPASSRQFLDPRGDALAGFQDPNLWIGLAVAAVMLYIVVRLRRYRDDT
jgi:ABC-2 type transport system permease protein